MPGPVVAKMRRQFVKPSCPTLVVVSETVFMMSGTLAGIRARGLGAGCRELGGIGVIVGSDGLAAATFDGKSRWMTATRAKPAQRWATTCGAYRSVWSPVMEVVS